MTFRSIRLASLPALLLSGTVACGGLPGLGAIPASGHNPPGEQSAGHDSPGALSAQQRIDAWKAKIPAERREQVRVEKQGRFLIARLDPLPIMSEDGMHSEPVNVEGIVATDSGTVPFSWVCGDFLSADVDFDGDGTEDLLMVVYDPTTSSACMAKDAEEVQLIVTKGGKLESITVMRDLGICDVAPARAEEKGGKPFVGAQCRKGEIVKAYRFAWDGKAIVRTEERAESNTQTGVKAASSYYQCELRFHCSWRESKDSESEPGWVIWSIDVENGSVKGVTFAPACPSRDSSTWSVDGDGKPVEGTWKTAKLTPMDPSAQRLKTPPWALKYRLSSGKLEIDTFFEGPRLCESQ